MLAVCPCSPLLYCMPIAHNFSVTDFIFILPALFHQVQMQYVSSYHMIRLNQKNGVFWDVTPCGSCNNRRFGGT
jgi:hypothetical protein